MSGVCMCCATSSLEISPHISVTCKQSSWLSRERQRCVGLWCEGVCTSVFKAWFQSVKQL